MVSGEVFGCSELDPPPPRPSPAGEGVLLSALQGAVGFDLAGDRYHRCDSKRQRSEDEAPGAERDEPGCGGQAQAQDSNRQPEDPVNPETAAAGGETPPDP